MGDLLDRLNEMDPILRFADLHGKHRLKLWRSRSWSAC
jgi:hypothetical protein